MTAVYHDYEEIAESLISAGTWLFVLKYIYMHVHLGDPINSNHQI